MKLGSMNVFATPMPEFDEFAGIEMISLTSMIDSADSQRITHPGVGKGHFHAWVSELFAGPYPERLHSALHAAHQGVQSEVCGHARLFGIAGAVYRIGSCGNSAIQPSLRPIHHLPSHLMPRNNRQRV